MCFPWINVNCSRQHFIRNTYIITSTADLLMCSKHIHSMHMIKVTSTTWSNNSLKTIHFKHWCTTCNEQPWQKIQYINAGVLNSAMLSQTSTIGIVWKDSFYRITNISFYALKLHTFIQCTCLGWTSEYCTIWNVKKWIVG